MARRLTDLVIPDAAPIEHWLTAELEPLHRRFEHWEAEGRPRTAMFNDADFTEYHRQRGLRDFFFFAKFICAFNADASGSLLEVPFHSDLAWAWSAPNGWKTKSGQVLGRERMAIVPRGHLKTTMLTQAYCAWRLVRDPEERILIYTHNVSMAEGMLTPIRLLMQGLGPRGQLFLACFGEIVPGKGEQDKWSATALTIKRHGVYTDPSIRASGVGSTLVGGHFTLQLVDDIVGDELPRAQMDKVCAAYDNLTPMFANLNTSERRICGTRWAFFDPYSRIERASPSTMVALRSWCEKDGKATEDYSREHMIFSQCNVDIALKLKKANPFLFSCWYCNNPRDADKLGFSESLFRQCRREGDHLIELDHEGREGRKIRLALCNIFVFVDPTSAREPGKRLDPNQHRKEGREGDFFGIIVLAVGPDNNWYVLRSIRRRWGVDTFVKETFTLVDQWAPKAVFIEQRGMQILYVHIFRTEFKRGRTPFLLLDWDGSPISKPDRISSLQSRYANGMIFHLEGSDIVNQGIADLEGELLDFPNPEFDDLSDALSAAVKKAFPPGKTLPRELTATTQIERDLMKVDPGSRAVWEIRNSRIVEDSGDYSDSSWFRGDTQADGNARYA